MTGKPDNLTSMAIFARVVERSGFSAAARDLGLSKSAVSKHVTRLEDRLSARLLDRTTRRVRLTDVGQTFYEHCQRVVAEAAAAEEAVGRLQVEPRGRLRVSVPVSFGVRHVAPLVPDYLARHPGVSLELCHSDRFVDLVGEGFDLAVRIAHLPDSSLIARRIGDNRRLVVAAPEYWERRGRPLVPKDLSEHDCLGYGLLAKRNEWRFAGPNGDVAVRIEPQFVADNGDALCIAAAAGAGVAWLPNFICRDDVAAGRLEPVLSEYEAPPQGLFAVYPHSRHPSPAVRSFVDHLVEHCPCPESGVTSRPVEVRDDARAV